MHAFAWFWPGGKVRKWCLWSSSAFQKRAVTISFPFAVFPLSFNLLKCHTRCIIPSSPLLFFKKHPSAPRNVNSPGFKYARSELGVNHHFVFITHSLSSLSRCARGMRSSGVMEVFVLLLAPVLCLPVSAPPKGCGSPRLVFRPNESCDWLGGLFPARPSTRLT